MDELIQDYGYWLILVGTIFEGETCLIMGALAASSGLLELPGVMSLAFIGAFIGDLIYFFLGRFRGRTLLMKRPTWKNRVGRMYELLGRYHIPLIIGARFMYGFRTPTLLALGLSPIGASRFVAFSALAAAAWAVVIGSAGFLLGGRLMSLFGKLKDLRLEIFIGAVVLGLLLWSVWFLRRRLLCRPTVP